MYGVETWARKKTEEKMDVAEMRMMRWICEVTKRDKIWNEVIRCTTGIRNLSDKIQESRLRWYGHVMRRYKQYIERRVLEMEVRGTRRKGRPKQSHFTTFKTFMNASTPEEEDAYITSTEADVNAVGYSRLPHDMPKWQQSHPPPTTH
ncbi:uncharacterized protein [Palaemon carinicauda]|uniref:uncharacterized protein n=1 Tax=Palaemon carinicauda TaxID=392227 RepID=UPI0035B63CC8